MRLTEVIPANATGASRFGIHFLKDALSCRYRWALKYLLPTADGRGLKPFTREGGPLDTGLAFHKFAEVYYTSRCASGKDTGVADFERALSAADTMLLNTDGVWDDEALDAARGSVREWCHRYHTQYANEWPQTEVYCDETGPWVEREFTIPLGPHGLYFTCRIDLVATHLGTLAAWDHKTTTASFAGRLELGMNLDPQPTGNLLALSRALPDLPITYWLMNVVVKNPAKVQRDTSVPPFSRPRIRRTRADLTYFEHLTTQLLTELDEQVDHWSHLCNTGMEPHDAILEVFPRSGQYTGACYAYNRSCEFEALCTAVGYERQLLTDFSTRVLNEKPSESATDTVDEENL